MLCYDEGNITASYVATAFGNNLSLKALLDRNANVNFTRLGPTFINETVDMLHFCKTFAYWEYSLLNIAAQNGHYETVLTDSSSTQRKYISPNIIRFKFIPFSSQ